MGGGGRKADKISILQFVKTLVAQSREFNIYKNHILCSISQV